MMLKRNLLRIFSIHHMAAWVVLASAVSVTALLLTSQPAAALPATPDWVSSDPVVVSQGAKSGDDQHLERARSSCQIQTVSYVANANSQVSELKKMCVVQGDGFRVAMGESPLGADYMAIAFGFSQKFYKLTYPGRTSGFEMVFFPGSKEYAWVSRSWQGEVVNIFDDLIKSIKFNLSGWYEVDLSSEPKWANSHGVGGWGVSDNGRYVAYGVGPSYSQYSFPYVLVLADTKTGEVSRIGTFHYVFEAYPMEPPKLRVSNDGSMIVASGGGGIKSWKIDQACFNLPDRTFTYDDKCPSRTYYPPINPWTYQYADNTSLRVSEDWSEMSYWHNIHGRSVWDKITIRASNIDPSDGLDYLALGDSYTSGEGDLVNGYVPGTEGDSGCHVSASSYPYLVSQSWGVLDGRMASVACSGARVDPDYVAGVSGYLGQNLELLRYPQEDYSKVRSFALQDFEPGFIPQLEFVRRYKPSVVTLTGGGNDVGFADVLISCATPGILGSDTCSYAKSDKALRILKNSIYMQYGTMTNLISQIHSASPSTKVYVVGYPQFVAQPGVLGCGLNAAALNQLEIVTIRSLVEEMNDVLWLAAKDSGAQFVDIEDSLEGGQVCGGGKYVNGFINTGISTANRSAMFHPNAAGHGRMAGAITQRVGNLGANVSPVPDRDAKSDSYYMSGSISRQQDMVVDDIYIRAGLSLLKPVVPALTFMPSTLVLVTVFSDPVELGQVLSEEDGSFGASFELPEEVGPGEHLLVLEGQSYAGDPITLYQHITIGVEEGDIDGDGIPDEEDRCQFITEWFDEGTGEDVCRESTSDDDGPGDTNEEEPGQPGDVGPGDPGEENPPSQQDGLLQKITAIIKSVVVKVKTVLTSLLTIKLIGWR